MVHISQAAFNGFHLRLPFRLGMQIIQVTWTTDGYPHSFFSIHANSYIWPP